MQRRGEAAHHSSLVLASASPRRRELLRALGVPFEVRAANLPEPLLAGVSARRQAEDLALAKACAVAETLMPDHHAEAAVTQPVHPAGDAGVHAGMASSTTGDTTREPAQRAEDAAVRDGATGGRSVVVLGADTIVVHDGVPLGKPADAEEARRMLRDLRGRPHEVVTSVAVVAGGHAVAVHATTLVHMRAYTDAEIERYIAGGDPFDKAGAYAIQHADFRPVARIEGCYCNVIGLPLWTVRALLAGRAPALVTRQPSQTYERCAACPLADPQPMRMP